MKQFGVHSSGSHESGQSEQPPRRTHGIDGYQRGGILPLIPATSFRGNSFDSLPLPHSQQPAITEPRPAFRDIGCRFGARLRDLRRAHNLTQIDMAVAFGIDRSYISDIECGKKGVSLATLEIIAIGFNIPLTDLLRDI